jgi:hypothetical protein
MGISRLLRPVAALVASACVLLPAGSASAQSEAEDAFRVIVQYLETLGATISHDTLNFDASTDTLTIPDLVVLFSGSIGHIKPGFLANSETPAASTPRELSYSADIAFGTETIKGLHIEDGNVAAQSMALAGTTSFTFDVKLEGVGSLRTTGTFENISSRDFKGPLPALTRVDPEHLFTGRWLPFLKSMAGMSMQEWTADKVSLSYHVYRQDGDRISIVMTDTNEMDGFYIDDLKDGSIRESGWLSRHEYSATRDGEKWDMIPTSEQEGTAVWKALNLTSLIALIDPDVPETGNEIAILGSTNAVDVTTSYPFLFGKRIYMTIGEETISDIGAVKRKNDVASLLDQSFSKRLPDTKELIDNVAQLIRSFRIGSATSSDRQAIYIAPIRDITCKVEDLRYTDISADGIGKIWSSGISCPYFLDGTDVQLGQLKIQDVIFADFDYLKPILPSLFAETPASIPEPLELARAFMPQAISIALEDLKVGLDGQRVLTVRQAEQIHSTSTAPTPTSLFSRIDNVSIAAASPEDEETKAFLKDIGLEAITWSEETRLHWDKDTLELTLEKLMVDVPGLGRAEATMRLANVQKTLFEDPLNQWQTALVSASFISADISFVDAGMTTKAIRWMAKDVGFPEATFAQALVAHAEATLQPIVDPAFAKTVSDAVADFLSNPGTFRVVLAPEKPVPVAQIVGSMVTPQVLPGLLNVQVTSSH